MKLITLLSGYRTPLIALSIVAIFTVHLLRSYIFRRLGGWSAYIYYATLVALGGSLGLRIVFVVNARRISFYDLTVWTIGYGAILFVFLSELLLAGGAQKLTRWFTPLWVKKLDYWYLAFAMVGLAWTINRLESVNQKIAVNDFAGPYVVATALVIRAIKTRAEINEWNKL
jgi:hypothetical protein